MRADTVVALAIVAAAVVFLVRRAVRKARARRAAGPDCDNCGH